MCRILAIAVLAVGLAPNAGAGQDLGVALEGAVAGVVLTLPVLFAVSAIRAPNGRYMWNHDQMQHRLRVTGATVVGLSAGLALVAHDRYRLTDALGGAVVGGAMGAMLGRGIAEFTSSTPEGRWGGFAIGMGVGAVAGTLAATLFRNTDDHTGVEATPVFSMKLPLSIPGVGR